jgi:diguanylate cyclase (GGDEF)-like protein
MPEHSVHGEEEAPRNELKLDDKRVLAFQHIDVHDDEHGSLWIFEDVTAERATAEQLIFLAERDTLTGVYNRRRFDTELERMVKRADRREQPMALVIFDLNDFKIINDSHGHAAGDQVLIDIARTVNKTVRQNEVFCRLGGDEFAVLMPEASAYDASMLSRRIEQQVTVLDFEFDGVKRRVSASLGIAVYPSHANDAQTLVAAADAAMYQAKKQDKRRVVVVRADARIEPDAFDDLLAVEAQTLRIRIQLVEIAYAQCQVGIGKQFYGFCFFHTHEQRIDVRF